MSSEFAMSEILEVCDNAGIHEDAVFPNYSGRSMYGKECLGIRYDNIGDILAFVVAAADKWGIYTMDDFYGMATDNFGLGMVAYWPSIQVDVEEDDGSDPDPDRREEF